METKSLGFIGRGRIMKIFLQANECFHIIYIYNYLDPGTVENQGLLHGGLLLFQESGNT